MNEKNAPNSRNAERSAATIVRFRSAANGTSGDLDRASTRTNAAAPRRPADRAEDAERRVALAALAERHREDRQRRRRDERRPEPLERARRDQQPRRPRQPRENGGAGEQPEPGQQHAPASE